jgi:hypothetical protein
VNRDVAWKVRQRAQDRCEYCHLPISVYPLPFHVDHIIARQHGGKTVLENLALACLHCNRHKGPNIAGKDSTAGSPIRLFHPRVDLWNEHFEWMGAELAGRTEVGRVTIQLLAINKSDFLAMRKALFEEQAFPLE